MPTEQYHEPPGDLPNDVRTYARLCTSLIEEAEAMIGSLKGRER